MGWAQHRSDRRAQALRIEQEASGADIDADPQMTKEDGSSNISEEDMRRRFDILEPIRAEAHKRHYQEGKPVAEVDAWYATEANAALTAAGLAPLDHRDVEAVTEGKSEPDEPA